VYFNTGYEIGHYDLHSTATTTLAISLSVS
jgi:hypothetical protein